LSKRKVRKEEEEEEEEEEEGVETPFYPPSHPAHPTIKKKPLRPVLLGPCLGLPRLGERW
jgi:hypothetical protein